MKICTKCKVQLPRSSFYADKRKSDGLYVYCKACHNGLRTGLPRAKRQRTEYMRTYMQLYKKANRAKYNAWNMKYHASKLQRTPKWLTDIDLDRIEIQYKIADLLCKVTGSKWEVDHIIPLQGELVSGLHVPSNLQVLMATDNRVKNNKFGIQ